MTLGLFDVAFLGSLQPPELWTPAAITTALWLDAADASTVTTVSGAVSQWNDKSGNGRNFAQSTASFRPTYSATAFNGKPALRFDGTRYLVAPSLLVTSGAWISILVVFEQSGVIHVPFCSATTTASNTVDAVRFLAISTRAGFGGSGGAGDAFVDPYSTNTAYAFNWGQVVNGPLRTNGSTVATGTPDAGVSTAISATLLGADGSTGTNRLRGLIQEVIITPQVPDTLTVQKVEGYQAHKWSFAASLPSDHPYKSAAPTL